MKIKQKKVIHKGYLEWENALERFPELNIRRLFGKWQYFLESDDYLVSIVKLYTIIPNKEISYWEIADMKGEYPEPLKRFQTLNEAIDYGKLYLEKKQNRLNKNREYQRKYHRKYYYANKEKCLKVQRRYCENNREKINEAQRKYRANNSEKVREYHRSYNLKRRTIKQRKKYKDKVLQGDKRVYENQRSDNIQKKGTR